MTLEFHGPPEPIMTDDGTIRVLQPTDDNHNIRKMDPGTWECHRCGTHTKTTLEDGTLPEPQECDGCERQGPFEHAELSNEDVQAAKQAEDMWFLPSGVDDSSYTDLWDDVHDYIRDHWDAQESDLYHGLTAYALSTWVRPNLTFVPHLMLMGKTTGGKTRLLNTLARISYRAIVSASATPSSLFRMIDAYNVSFFVSEYHGLSHDSQLQLDNIVRAGQKHGEKVTRATQTAHGYEPETFDPFSHIAIATQYTPDDDIVNRCIQIHSSPDRRDMPPTLDEERGQAIRNRLLYARYRLLNSDEWKDAEQQAYTFIDNQGIDGRTREKLLSLVTVAILWDHLDSFKPFVKTIVEQDRDAAADSEDAQFIEVVRDLAFEEIGNTATQGDADPYGAIQLSYSEIVERYEQVTGIEKSPSWIGHVCSRLGLETERKRDGTVIQDPDLGPTLQELCTDLNLGWEPNDVHDPICELDENEQHQGTCSECGERPSTHRYVTEGYHVCATCAEGIREAET